MNLVACSYSRGVIVIATPIEIMGRFCPVMNPFKPRLRTGVSWRLSLDGSAIRNPSIEGGVLFEAAIS